MKRIISFILVAACALSLIVLSVFAASIEVSAPIANEVETTVAPTISEDYIPSENPQTHVIINPKKIELEKHLIICEYEKPTTKVQAQNNQNAVKEYIYMIYDMLPEQHESVYVEFYLIACSNLDSAYQVYQQYQTDIEIFETEEREAARKKAEAEKKAKEEAARKKAEAEKEAVKQQAQIDDNADLKYMGEFKLTAYCPCRKCCGKWANGITSTGVTAKAGRTIAVDPKVIPYGTKVVINGKVYVAEDCGGSIKGNRIDVYFNDHSDALDFGVKKNVKIYIVKE
jgi:3D (Asp-Asp-Asp) domain-containing protein